MDRRPIGRSELVIEPLVFGGNVLGWTLQEDEAFAVLDAYLDAGFTAIDTADTYGKGVSEEILGRWMKARGNRSKVHVFTKLGSEMAPGKKGLSPDYVREAVEASLKRLQTDYIDLYQCHRPDPETSHEETLGAFDPLIRSGRVRVVGTSNYTAPMIAEALDVSVIKSLPRYESEQPLYNLYDRDSFEGELQDLCVEREIGVLPYFSLAAGFLTGKYRKSEDFETGARSARVKQYDTDKGRRILSALDEVSEKTGAQPAQIALAWLIAQPGVTAPIASATSLDQLESLTHGVRLKLEPEDIETLTAAGRG